MTERQAERATHPQQRAPLQRRDRYNVGTATASGTPTTAGPLQRLAVDEFAEDGGRRDGGDLRWGERHDAGEELEHTRSLGVGRRVRRDAAQQERDCRYLPEVGFRSKGRMEDTVSGDRGATFRIGRYFYLILCDGMGTGPGAAAEAGAAIGILRTLLQSGVEPADALQLLNGVYILRHAVVDPLGEMVDVIGIVLLRCDIVADLNQVNVFLAHSPLLHLGVEDLVENMPLPIGGLAGLLVGDF